MTESLFQQQGNDQIVEPQIDENKNYLEELVGEGKKFKTSEELAKGKFYADQMVSIQNQRLDELRKDYLKLREENTKQAKLEEMMDQLNQRLASNAEPKVNEDNQQPKFNLEEIDQRVANKFQEIERIKQQTQNANLVKIKLREQYGTNYQSVLKEKTEDLGLTEDYVNDLAKNHPNVLFRALELDRKQNQDSFQSPPRSNQRNDSFAPKGAQVRSWMYYQNLKKTNPTLYFDRKTAIQMQQDAIDLGEKFRDGDYYVKGLHE